MILPNVEPSGTLRWTQNHEFHRLNGPAVIWFDGFQSWWKNGKRHRKDGPALIWPDGRQSWWKNGEFTKENL
jgi:hypothetical protein